MEDRFKNYNVITYNNGVITSEVENIVEEKSMDIYINGEKFFKIVCSPFNLEEMVVGFLWMNNIIDKLDEIISTDFSVDGKILVIVKKQEFTEERKIIKNNSTKTIKAEEVPEQMKLIENQAMLFEKTGGVHSAALVDNGELIVYMEDVGRHNTLDKITGYCLINNISMEDKIMVFSGRLPLEIVTKICRMHIPIMISMSAPTNLGVDLAREYGVTLCGFTRKKRYHIYANEYRIKNNLEV